MRAVRMWIEALLPVFGLHRERDVAVERHDVRYVLVERLLERYPVGERRRDQEIVVRDFGPRRAHQTRLLSE